MDHLRGARKHHKQIEEALYILLIKIFRKESVRRSDLSFVV